MIARRPARPGFTLLEVLLASAIGVMLLGGLYVAFDMTLRQTDAGRQATERGDLARSVVNRMTIDLSGCVGPLQPKSGGGITQSDTGAEVSAAAPTTESTPTTGTGTGTTTETPAANDPTTAAAPTTTTATADIPFQGGVYGTDKQLTLYVSRVPPALAQSDAETAETGVIDTRPDLRRVTYYLASSGGLCRQEKPWVTAEGVRNSVDPSVGDDATDMLSDEVLDATFEYFDGGGWASEWTGSETLADGVTPMGPPRAIRVTLVIQPGGPSSGIPAKRVQHVFPLRAAVGLYQPMETTTADPATGTPTEGM